MRFSALMVLTAVGLAQPGLAVGQVQRAETRSNSPLRAMVWLQPETDAVLDRIRGQTNDLAVDLVLDTLDAVPSDLNAQLMIANTLSERHQVSLVIWFVKQTDSERHFVVYIALPKTHRLLTRDLGPSDAETGGDGLSSAVKEGAALVVRAAIQAVLSGSTIGEVQVAPAEESAGDFTAQAAVATPGVENKAGAWRDATERPGTPNPARATKAVTTTDRPWAVGLELSVPDDGAGNSGVTECASLRIERRFLPFDTFFAGGACARRQLGIAAGTVNLQRQQVLAGANYVVSHPGFQVSLGVQMGAVFYERETRTFPLGEGRASSLYTLGAAGPQFRLLVPLRGSPVWASGTLGVDLLTNSLKISYSGPAGLPTAQIRAVQPYAALGLVLRF